jgi:hypothetical protein
MIMPIASPAIVKVNHVEGDPITGSTNIANAGTSSNGFQSKSSAGLAVPFMVVGSLIT